MSADLQAGDMISTEDLTLGFDSTTQDGALVNNIRITSLSSCQVLDLDQLIAGTAQDYSLYIDSSVSCISEVYSNADALDFTESKTKMISITRNTD